jgi:hypothetical protein
MSRARRAGDLDLQADESPADDGQLQQLSPHDQLEAGIFHAQRRGAGNLRQVPQQQHHAG